MIAARDGGGGNRVTIVPPTTDGMTGGGGGGGGTGLLIPTSGGGRILKSPVVHPPRDLLAGRAGIRDDSSDDDDGGDGDGRAPDSPVLVPNDRWRRDTEEEGADGELRIERFLLARQKLKDLLLADPVLREKAETFVRTLMERAQAEAVTREPAPANQGGRSADDVSLKRSNEPGEDGADDEMRRQQAEDLLDRLPSLEGINRVMNLVSGGVSRAFHRVVVCGETFLNFTRRRREQHRQRQQQQQQQQSEDLQNDGQ